jgi:NAD-dependent SIR2 family protein deacetylase
MEPTFAAAKPGRGHRALASLYKAGKIPAIVTQNIDNLHQVSGFAAEHVVELHGNTTYARCIGCGHAYDLAWVRQRFDATGGAPDCTICDEPVKTATISFGQATPCHRACPALRPVYCDRVFAGGLAGRRISNAGQKLRRQTGDHQQRTHRTG